MTQENQVTPEQLNQLEEFGKRFMDLKLYLLKLNLPNIENVRICIQYLDDSFMRGREAIFSPPIVSEYEDEKDKKNSELTEPELDAVF
jgi:hypothetical protein